LLWVGLNIYLNYEQNLNYKMINEEVKNLFNFLIDFQCIYNKIEKHKREIKNNINDFNIFNIISELYYRENFHSDLIYSLLLDSIHDNGKDFLFEFINVLNLKCKININLNDFKSPVLSKEKDKIDIRIRDNISKKSIIIENKINDANDTYRQLPRYLLNEKNNGFDVVGIVYLRLTKAKTPNTLDWTANEVLEIKKVLIFLDVFEENEVNLVTNWIQNCQNITKNKDVLSTLNQYSKLLLQLRHKKMNQEISKEFYKKILQKDNYSKARSVETMLNELGHIRALNTMENLVAFETLFNKKNVFQYDKKFRLKYENSRIKNLDIIVDIVSENDFTKVYFAYKDDQSQRVLDIIEHNYKKEIIQINDKLILINFKFPDDEMELLDFLLMLFKNLDQLNNN
jgi:hypothetical protein